jgi:hypothetical protein
MPYVEVVSVQLPVHDLVLVAKPLDISEFNMRKVVRNF